MFSKWTTVPLLAVAFLVWAPIASAWTWPVKGPVLQPFRYDAAHPYAAGQHRGVDIGADAAGGPVLAPAAGTVSFVGTVPVSGKCVTIETPDGYSVTLTHLGSVAVAKGASVLEAAVVGTVGPSGTPDFAQPYVHLGIRLTAEANGYLDPLGLLPPLAPPTQDGGGMPSSAGAVASPAADGGSGSAPAPVAQPAPPAPAPAAQPAGTGLVIRDRGSARASVRPESAPEAVHHDTPRRPSRPEKRPVEPASKPRTFHGAFARPAAGEPDAVAHPATPATAPSSSLLAALPGIVAAFMALTTAFVRRRRGVPSPAAVLPFPEEGTLRRAA